MAWRPGRHLRCGFRKANCADGRAGPGGIVVLKTRDGSEREGSVAFWHLSGDIGTGLARIGSETVASLGFLVSA
jgi:hypothetical protein